MLNGARLANFLMTVFLAISIDDNKVIAVNGNAVKVKDTGMGIAPDMQDKIFDIFTAAARTQLWRSHWAARPRGRMR
jgi:hypothetical protein